MRKPMDHNAIRQAVVLVGIAIVLAWARNLFVPSDLQLRFQEPALSYAADTLFSKNPASLPDESGDDPSLTEPVVVSTEQRETLIAENRVILLDARSKDEYHQGHIPAARHLPFERLYEFLDVIERLDRSKWIVCYCDGPPCELGELLAWELFSRGIPRVAIYADGLEAWTKAGNTIKGTPIDGN